ncbi:hypothetical protein RQP46_007125 [Phenoliferia psychrophenolica]
MADVPIRFLLAFDDGSFSEDATFLVTDWLAHTPKEVIAKNFQVAQTDLANLPKAQLWIFNGTPDNNTLAEDAGSISAPAGVISPGYSYHFSKLNATWHLSSDEWSFFISGQGRVIAVASGPNAARTFDFRAGDVGYIQKSNGHYIENLGNEPLVLLEVLKTHTFSDIALGQWLSLTPKQVVQDHLKLSGDIIEKIFSEEKTKHVIVGGA